MKHIKTLLFLICCSIIIQACSESNAPPEDKGCEPFIKSVHTALGVPTDNDPSDDYYIIRPQYVISYNKNRNVANWVSWNLNKDWYGDAPRHQGKFITDTTLPTGFYRVKHDDYTNSGFDRGHIVRSEERTATEEDNISTFYLTNILPQTPDLNQGVWLNFEYYCENLCKNEDKELYIIAGGIFHSKNSINGLIAVPDSCFKIVVVMDRGKGLKDVNENTTIYSVVMPNIAGIRSVPWVQYKTTVRRIENSTGYDFLSCVPKKIQNVIETK